jgi:hypothetical protein
MANPTGKGGFKERPHQINKAGREKGSKNKSYLDPSHWLGRANEEIDKERDPEKRVKLITWATELIMQKVPVLPSTPGESVNNAIVAQGLLTALEQNAPDPVNPSPAPISG